MAVYVDASIWRYGRMTMCHMIADTAKELREIATSLGLKPRWIQHEFTQREHFDISKTKRAEAVKLGAISVTHVQFIEILRTRKDYFPSSD